MASAEDSGADAARAPKTENTTDKIAELCQRLQSLSDGIRAADALKGDCDENITFAWALRRLLAEAYDADEFLGT